MDATDEKHLRAAIELSRRARENGNEPFGALLADPGGDVLLEAQNTQLTERDVTGHAETNLARTAYRQLDDDTLSNATLYSSCEPCPMCSGAIYWSGVGRLVYALSGEGLLTLKGEGKEHLPLSCRAVLDKGSRTVAVEGPALEEEARQPHHGFWNG